MIEVCTIYVEKHIKNFAEYMELFLIFSNQIYNSTYKTKRNARKTYVLCINCHIKAKSIIFGDDVLEPVGSNRKM